MAEQRRLISNSDGHWELLVRVSCVLGNGYPGKGPSGITEVRDGVTTMARIDKLT